MSREGALWIGGLENYMDEDFILKALQSMGETNVLSIKVIKNKFTGGAAGYGFINFISDNVALTCMHKLNGKLIPGTNPPVRLDQQTRAWLGIGFETYSIYIQCYAIMGKVLFLNQGTLLNRIGKHYHFSYSIGNYPLPQFHSPFFLFQIIGGIGSGNNSVASMALVISDAAPDEREMHIGLIETSTGIGFLLGPLWGSMLYQLGGYPAPFGFSGKSPLL